MPKVSVIVPVYNTEEYLCECVDSLLEQTLSDIEVILVDDGSTDHSPQICDEYAAKDMRIKVIHKPNGGLSSARNCGMEAANGQYFAFVDSDDVCEKNMYEHMVSVAEEKDAKMVICSANYWNGDSVRPIPCDESRPCIETLSSHDIIQRMWSSEYDCSIFTAPWNKLYHREYFLAGGGKLRYREGIIYEDDEAANRLYLSSYKIAVINHPYYYWRMRQGSISHKPFSQKNCIFLPILLERVSSFESIGMDLAAKKTAKMFCEIYIEYFFKAWNCGHKEWIQMYKRNLNQMRRYAANMITLKTRVRYILFDVSPYLYRKCIMKN